MPYYESVLIARQDLSTQQVEAMAELFAGVIQSSGGKIAKNEYWGLKPLAYRIKKNRKGHYHQLTIDAPAAAVQEMERQMRLNEDLLRHLTVRTDELDLEPSVMMQKPSRDDRPRRGNFDRDDKRDNKRDDKRDDKSSGDNSAKKEGE